MIVNHTDLFGGGGGGAGATVVTHLSPTSGISGSNAIPYMGKMRVAYQWSAVYSTEP